MKVLDAEKKVGIETFFSPYKGIKGKLRNNPEDFCVKEIFSYPNKSDKQRFTIAEITDINWETNHLIKSLSNWLHISRQRIGFAGTKDKRAKTTRLMSFSNVSKEQIEKIKLKDVKIKNIYYSDKSIRIGNLVGNEFDINIRNIDKKIDSDNVKLNIEYLTKKGGFPNFFGIQRFGIVRPITHIVGKHIINENFKKAVMTYIANPIKGEDEISYNLRKNLEKTLDFADALKNYPNNLNFEKAMLNKLVTNPEDFIGALNEVPKNLMTMFIYAYQSFIFNKILSERIKRKIPINKAIEGDLILPIRNGEVDLNPILVKQSNILKVNKQISKNKALISGVLVGYDSIFSQGEIGEIEHKIIEKEKINPKDFIIPEIPFLSSSGTRRPILGWFNKINYKIFEDELNPDSKVVNLNFSLKKGSYATSLLREIMKSDDIKNY